MTHKKWRFNKDKLKDAREIMSLTQEEIADKMNVSRQSYNTWENGQATPTVHSLIKVCNVLGVKPEIFFVPEPDDAA
jgi:transcriptional regulator with XRE-family HTH domain